MKDIEKFKEDIQKILDKFQFDGEARRKIFSQLVQYADIQGAAKRANSILYKNKPPSSEDGEQFP